MTLFWSLGCFTKGVVYSFTKVLFLLALTNIVKNQRLLNHLDSSALSPAYSFKGIMVNTTQMLLRKIYIK